MKAILPYGAATGVITAVLALGIVLLVGAVEPAAVWVAAVAAWGVQMAAFAVLVLGRGGPGFMVGWGGGMALRFAAVGVAALWLTRTEAFDPASLLLSMVGLMFVLVLLEPLFLRLAD